MTRYQQRRFICPSLLVLAPPVEPEVTFASNNKKAPSGSAGGGFLGYPALLAVLSKRFALTQHGADTGLVVAGAEYAVLVDAAHRVGVPHARLGGLMVPVAVVVSTVPCNRKLVLVGELKFFLSPDLNTDIIPVCSLLKGRLLVELSGRALIPLPARSQPAAGTR